MKAAVLKGPKKLVVEEVPDPKPGPDEALLKMRHCGICGSDIHLYESSLAVPGSIMGHEWVAEVVEVGPGVTRWKPGDRVWPGGGYIANWSWKPEYGWDLEAWARDDFVKDMGGYGEYAVYHRLSIAAVPESVSDIEACMADQAATALGGVYAAGLRIGESVLVIGAGPIGLWSLRCSQLAGASKIGVAELIQGRVEHARKMGADLIIDPSMPDVRKRLTEFFDGIGPEVVLECGGTESALQLAIDVVRPEGRIAIVGISQRAVSIEPMKMYLKGLEMKSVLHIDFPGGMEIIRQKKVDCQEFLTEIISLEQVPETFERSLHPTDEEKIIVQYR